MTVNADKIAVVLPSHLGDVAMATPALRALRLGHPRAALSLVAESASAELLAGTPGVARWIVHDTHLAGGAPQKLRHRIALARELGGHDAAIVFPNSFASALLPALARIPLRVGYARAGRGALLTHPLPAPRSGRRFRAIAMERYYLDLVVRGLDCPDPGTALELFTDTKSDEACRAWLAARGVGPDVRVVAIAPGAGFGPSKLWPARSFAFVAAGLQKDGCAVVLIHAPGEESIAAAIERAAPPGLLSFGGRDSGLGHLKSIIARSQLVLCNDAGARHIAAAFRIPTLCMFGPTSLAYTNLNLAKTRVMREPVACSPCQKKVCPIDHRCMTRLAPSRVLSEARAALSDPDWRGSVELEHTPS